MSASDLFMFRSRGRFAALTRASPWTEQHADTANSSSGDAVMNGSSETSRSPGKGLEVHDDLEEGESIGVHGPPRPLVHTHSVSEL